MTAYYFTPMTALSCISIINAVFVLKLFYYGRHNHPIPGWMKLVLVKYLAPLVCYQQIAYDDDTEETRPNHSKPITLSQKQQQEDGNVEETQSNNMNKETPEAGDFYMDDDEPKDEATRRSHMATDWQNVALIWDKFMMIVMTMTTCISLTIVFFLYVAEIQRDNRDFEHDDGIAEESK